ncbi:MAG: helix-turn-helix transcriptional regulator [Anaerolineae bacterium]|nr:helix-turn-helix transcriptional regulator [Anaerolineae bacterium]
MAEDLRVLRGKKGMTLAQLASKTGISIQALQTYETGAQIIPYGDLKRLAKALYVEEWDINPRSTLPPPGTEPPSEDKEEAQPARKDKKPPKEKKEKKEPRVSPPARESQIKHLLQLAAHFEIDRSALEAEIGKPLEALTQLEARHWNSHFSQRIAETKPPKPAIDRRRAHLPEGVDGFEMRYLDEVKEAGDVLTFTLFDRTTVAGQLVGYGAYNITIRQGDGTEVSLNKLAIAYYRRAGGGT